METIRRGIFETNSSSTHAIVIPKSVDKEEWSTSDSLYHDYCFGREECRFVNNWDEKLAYIYMVLKERCSSKDVRTFEERVNRLFNEVNKNVRFPADRYDPTPDNLFDYINKNKSDGNLCPDSHIIMVHDRGFNYVDHLYEIPEELINRILSDDEFLKRFLFNEKSYITVGGDEYRGYNIKTIGFQYDYEESYKLIDDKGEEPPKEWFDENGEILDEFRKKYNRNYHYKDTGEFWDKLEEYKKDNDVYLKGN